MTLYEVTGPAVLDGTNLSEGQFGVFVFDPPLTPTDSPELVPSAGPSGISGLIGSTRDARSVMIASRQHSDAELAAILASADELTTNPQVDRSATLSDSPVPGIGSLQIPANANGFAISYVEDNPTTYQRSVAITSFEGGTENLLAIAWWIDATLDAGTGTWLSTVPAFTVNDDSFVPDATYRIWASDGIVTVVRETDARLALVDGRPALTQPSQADLERLSPLRPTG